MARRRYLDIALVALPILALGAAVAFSPYGRRGDIPYRHLAESTDIAASCSTLFRYLGNSANAADWSVFVDHITHLNPQAAADGEVGSIRRSFRDAHEKGMRWDEYIVEVVLHRRRRLRVYDVVGSTLPVTTPLLTDQIYEPSGPDRCRLTFTLFFERKPSPAEELRMHVASYEIARIFRRNIAGIKHIAEQQATGAR